MSDETRDHPLAAPFDEVERLLGVRAGASAKELRRAYRQAVRLHPPDRDRAGFERVRAAYLRAGAPLEAARTRLLEHRVLTGENALGPPEGPAPSDRFHDRAFRALVGGFDLGFLDAEPAE